MSEPTEEQLNTANREGYVESMVAPYATFELGNARRRVRVIDVVRRSPEYAAKCIAPVPAWVLFEDSTHDVPSSLEATSLRTFVYMAARGWKAREFDEKQRRARKLEEAKR